jgi:parallel beta-helix repeat protein
VGIPKKVAEDPSMASGIGRRASILAIAALGLGTLGPGQCSNVIVVDDGESIQAAVDAAMPGDTIVVRAGLYTGTPGDDAVVTVMKDDITLIGNPNAVIDATGLRYGVSVGDIDAGCLVDSVSNFTIKGFTIQNADDSGLYIANVDGYSATGGQYFDNEEYGPYPVCSTNGRVAFNFASGHNDAAIYVGQSDGAVIEYNTVVDSVIGVEVENTANTIVRHNLLKKNSAGILVVVLPGLNIPATDNVLIEHNIINRNNRENTGGGFLVLLPFGTGILNVGGDDVVIRDNVVMRNQSVGIASIGNPFVFIDPRIEPFVDGLVVADNVVLHNGADPDPASIVPGADLVFVPDVVDPGSGTVLLPDPDPSGNCFEGNVYDTDYPEGIVDLFPCP